MTSIITPVFQYSDTAEILHATASDPVLCTISRQGIATLTLNRPDKANAFDDQLIAAIRHYLQQLASHSEVSVLVLRAAGKHFSAGADLRWMKAMARKKRHDNLNDAQALAFLMNELDTFPHPTIALVQGSAFGGALGLICCCDIALGSQDARFSLSEVKLGLIPATIGPYVCRTIGQRHARRLMLTAETMNADMAHQLGILHEVSRNVSANDSGADTDNSTGSGTLENLLQLTLNRLLANSPAAMTQVKTLCKLCEQQPIDAALIRQTSEMIADIRVSSQGQEGLNAFFDKRRPAWVKHNTSGQGEHNE
ncbi:enoyl-CoA hydratase/isomerase family protein [Photobacterium sp. WH24]|uniref:enoyl-CoA hydratase-related protein n=1 Tax=Photobacterium sp. WH24 TaxID=2827237 RepID=UPI001C46D816|nr:enoyl-CoA hydratase-related protein [Photobacterium sp. WH24]MBV7263236.1 enoyl-CoA hydratase/isomerase family protein [Photobacterium sp. WH24]